ncbi:DUF1254 domain-containing protein [Mesorhizobium sp. LHD-90]|uniref:DUF1254 domain-containing protein n=1 Tax=Mesorhizobium sp. LHD-90 TaxID=3071414 RepID=UPI0027DFA43E|nr:DUF1254 domain-containing protein [Mesorhizobium sp. LHD-90]MDQ6436862.1 DUF1254 domain-containing protein [Mesorhizobium sp. LHD-90]
MAERAEFSPGLLAPVDPQRPGASRWPLAYALIIGLVGAGIVHIIVLLLVPEFADRNAWTRLAAIAPLNRTTPLEGDALDLIASPDPAFQVAACRFDLASGTLHVAAAGKVPFWSASVYDRGGRALFSLNDRSGTGEALDFVVLTPEQMIGIRHDLPEEFAKSVFVEIPADEGMLLVRAFAPDASWKPLVSRFIAGMRCAPQ